MKNILVTGGAGFLGAAMVRRLLEQGHRVRVLDDLTRGRWDRLSGMDVECVRGDIRRLGDVEQAVYGFDTVFHLAAVNGTRHFYEKPWEVLEVAVRGMLNVVEACRGNVPELVLFSSSEAYQDPYIHPTPEDVPLVVPDPQNPRYSYGAGKILSEVMAHCSGAFERVLVIRPHNVYGPDAGYDHVVPELIMRVARATGSPGVVEVKGGGSRTYIYVDDFSRAVLHLFERGESGCFHVGVSRETPAADLCRVVGNAMGKWILPKVTEGRCGAVDRRYPDTGKLLRTGWAPRVSLEEGISETAEWYLARRDQWPEIPRGVQG